MCRLFILSNLGILISLTYFYHSGSRIPCTECNFSKSDGENVGGQRKSAQVSEQTANVHYHRSPHLYPRREPYRNIPYNRNVPYNQFSEAIDALRSIFVGHNLVDQKLIKILIWTKYHKASALTAVEDWERRLSESVGQCPYRCQFTANRRILAEADAVVFHSTNVHRKDLPPYRNPNQIWVFLEEEPPRKARWDLKEVPNIFNWTMTYRRDSDIYHPYGQVVPKVPNHQSCFTLSTSLSEEQKRFLSSKTKLAAWTVSNCITSSKREQLVIELRKYIPINIFGRCGFENHPCIKEWPNGCLTEIESKYKFYFAFENSLCSEYVTEKFFQALARNVVPVVYGFENYSMIAPPGSVIDARLFPSPKGLAEYLEYLDNTPEEYLKYYEWKNHYRILPKGVGWCKLCERLGQRNTSEHKWYTDIWKWWWYLDEAKNVVVESPPSSKMDSDENIYVQSTSDDIHQDLKIKLEQDTRTPRPLACQDPVDFST